MIISMKEVNERIADDIHLLQWYAPDLAAKPAENWTVGDLGRNLDISKAEHRAHDPPL